MTAPALIARTHHPWRYLRERLPDRDVTFVVLPDGMLGATITGRRQIYLDRRQLQAQRRCTIDHELHHAEAGDIGPQHPHREAQINQASARLLPLAELLRVLPWAHHIEEAADELWVDRATLRTRLDHLHPAEIAAIRRAFANRDNT